MATICDGCLGDNCPCGIGSSKRKDPPIIKTFVTYTKKVNYWIFRKSASGERIGFGPDYYIAEITDRVGTEFFTTSFKNLTSEEYLLAKLKGDA